MRHLLTTLALILVALAIGAVLQRRRKLAKRAGEPNRALDWSIRAYSFQSDGSFDDAMALLVGGEHGEWFERDSAWWDQLMSCPARQGVRMNLYYFDDRNVLELKADSPDADRSGAETYALRTLLPALGAREVRRTSPVN